MKKFSFILLLLTASALSLNAMAEEAPPTTTEQTQDAPTQTRSRIVEEPIPPGIDLPLHPGEGSAYVEEADGSVHPLKTRTDAPQDVGN